MTRGRARVHLASDTLRRGRCGWNYVECETDASKVTCKSCLAVLAGKRLAGGAGRTLSQAPSRSDLASELSQVLAAPIAPIADASPVVTPAVWASSCKGAEHRRCGDCDLCVWERDAQLWNHVSAWNTRHVLQRPEGAPRWPSLAAALSALVEFDAQARTTPSALGGILDRAKRGAMGTSGDARADDPLMRRAGELVRVRQALELAYPEGAHPTITCEKLRAVLLLRTPGVASTVAPKKSDAPAMPSYEQLAELFAVPVGELQALVRTGRRVVAEDLAERGLIPAPRPGRMVTFTKGTSIGPTTEILPRMLRELHAQGIEIEPC